MNILAWKKRPFIYSLIVTTGFAFLLSILDNLPDSFYFTGSAVLFLIFVFELFSTHYYAARILEQFGFPPLSDEKRMITFIQHSILPTFAYFGIVLFLFFNHHPYLNFAWLLLIFIMFSLLFTNIRAYHEDKFNLEATTNGIYDILLLVISFVTADGIVNASRFAGLNNLFVAFLISVLSIVLCILVFIRYRYLKPRHFKLLGAVVLLIFVTAFVLVSAGLSALAVAMAVSLLLYYLIAYINHKRDGTATASVFAEYLVVFLILLVILYGSTI
jgi:hypothetical protein